MSYIRTPAAGGHFTPGVHIWCFISGKKKKKTFPTYGGGRGPHHRMEEYFVKENKLKNNSKKFVKTELR